MRKFSIYEEVHLTKKTKKCYLTTYKKDGFEMGFGKKGVYKGHSHEFFTDVIFSFEGIHSSNYCGDKLTSNLIIAPSRSYLGEVTIGDFYFIKFCDLNEEVIFPEKVETILSENDLITGKLGKKYTFPWYKRKGLRSEIHFSFSNELLLITIGKDKIEISE